ncbi:MAG TPA: hypothetical protein VGE72_00825 [Azospirillum sp.]
MVKGRCGAISVAAMLGALLLAGCSERTLDTGLVGAFTGDNPPPGAPSPIRPMSGEKTDYPNLATVPPRPTDLSTEQQRQAQMKSLEQDRSALRARKKALEDQYKPLTAPPKPKVTPGRQG